MKLQLPIFALVALLCVAVPAQPVTAYFPDNVTLGGGNAFPWNTQAAPVAPATGYTICCIYPASVLTAAGVVPGGKLTGLAFAPQTGAGTLVAPNVKIFAGNAVAAPTTIGWLSNMTVAHTIWDSSVDGTFTSAPWVAWTVANDAWSPLPFSTLATPNFTWDGVSAVCIMVSHGGGQTGGYTLQSSPAPGYPRHGTTQFNPVAGVTATTTTGVLAPRIRMVFECQGAFNVTSTAGDLVVTPPTVGPATAEGYTFVSGATTGVVGSGGFFGISPDAVTFLFLPTPAGYGNPLHWISSPPVPGVYPFAPFTLPPGAMSGLAGLSWDFVSFGFAPGFASWEISCVKRVAF